MRVVHVDTGKTWRGGQRQALFLHEGLTARNHESVLVCRKEGELAARASGDVRPWRFRNELDLGFARRLRNLANGIGADIVHAHDAHALTPCLIAKLLGMKAKVVHTRRVDFSIRKNILSTKKYTSGKVDAVVAISNGIRDVLIDDGVSPEKIPVIPSGVRLFAMPDEKTVAVKRTELGIRSTDIVVGCAAYFAPHKDHATLVSGFARAAKSVPDAKLLLLGEGELEADIRALAHELGIEDRVLMPGFVNDIPAALSCMHVYAQTSEMEGLGTAIIDAMHAGLPVVATKAGGIPELFTGTEGTLCDVGGVSCIARALETYLTDASARAAAGAAAHERAKAFSSDAMVEGYVELYGRLVHGG